MSRLLTLAGATFIAFASATSVRADVAVFRNGDATPLTGGTYAGTDDLMLVANGPGETTQNFGGRTDFEVGELVGLNGLRHGLVRFDVSALAGKFASVQSITLRLFPTIVDAQPGDSIQAHLLADANAGWIEGTFTTAAAGDPPDNGVSTWDARVQGSQNWAGVAGASSAGIDYTSLLGQHTFDTASTTAGAAFDITLSNGTSDQASIINGWLDGTNGGVFLRTSLESEHLITFSSSEASLALRPQLIVTYTVPEPSIGLLAGVAIAVVGRGARRSRRATPRKAR